MERPFKQVKRLLREANKKELETFKFIFEKSDNISLWIIGLAIGGIAIFANNIADIQSSIPNSYLNSILTLLTISVCCGIIYRILYLYFFVALNNSFGAIDIAFSDYKSMDTESSLTGNESFSELIVELKIGFGQDLSYLKETYKTLDKNGKQILYDSIKTQYLESVKFASQDEENIWDFVGDTYSKFLGVKKSKFIKKMKNNDFGKQFKKSKIAVTFFYFTYIISFLLGLILFVVGCSNPKPTNDLPSFVDSTKQIKTEFINGVEKQMLKEKPDSSYVEHWCSIEILKATEKQLGSLDLVIIADFLASINPSCKSNVEYSEWSNELLFDVLNERPEMVLQLLIKNSSLYRNEILTELKNPITDKIDLHTLSKKIKDIKEPKSDYWKPKIIESLVTAIEKK